ncbi:hypothetical protein J7E97_10880 [Streptomyces sp. ISL-66]|uniref:hypothetical protein n=1 Tax=Streptomyces sp. ISL-66 TaxID=2819186 RepID=UPI001BE957A9|nr:hypothetical protein [Streptomyces sp. ISL-66]MBT2468369.1 hypothetical protein [Streptomyces sp. ISL-66]
MAVHQTNDGLPASMTEDDAGGTASPEFTRLARAGLDGANDAMFAECERLCQRSRNSPPRPPSSPVPASTRRCRLRGPPDLEVCGPSRAVKDASGVAKAMNCAHP